MFGLDAGLTSLLIICLIIACLFEFVNGFHDTANAVATVIYTHSLKPQFAVIWSGFWNFVGVNLGGIAVAMGIVNLLPMEVLMDQNVYHSISLILSLIVTAVAWNLGTWYFGIPCSSSHTLLGSIFGVGLACMILPGSQSVALNWGKVGDVMLSLLVSPLFGFGLAALIMFLLRNMVKNNLIFKEPPTKKAPPFWIRTILILSCTSVSFSHGSNDGQKGVGLVMIILIGIAPAFFAVDTSKDPSILGKNVAQIELFLNKIDTNKISIQEKSDLKTVFKHTNDLETIIAGNVSFINLKDNKQFAIRKDILTLSKKVETNIKNKQSYYYKSLAVSDVKSLESVIKETKSFTEYSPTWVIIMISLSLGFGTMIGWKRIVVTIGEKIGKSHLTYSQGFSAELVAASTIGASSWLGLPVSTTHVLSSGIAGSMVAGGGLKNLQPKTVKSILIAWLITLPVTILLSGTMFLILRMIFV